MVVKFPETLSFFRILHQLALVPIPYFFRQVRIFEPEFLCKYFLLMSCHDQSKRELLRESE